MRTHAYKLAGANIPKELVGQILNVRVAESSDDARSLCKDGNEGRIIDLFNQQNILNQERVGKAIAEGEDVQKLVAAGDVAGALALVQTGTDAYLSGAKAPGVGGKTKAKAQQMDKVAAAAAADPKLAAKLQALGITF